MGWVIMRRRMQCGRRYLARRRCGWVLGVLRWQLQRVVGIVRGGGSVGLAALAAARWARLLRAAAWWLLHADPPYAAAAP